MKIASITGTLSLILVILPLLFAIAEGCSRCPYRNQQNPYQNQQMQNANLLANINALGNAVGPLLKALGGAGR
ncbi:hypothetical protein Y032_0306g1974 [Ancylostoma ceylanicum]|nr:hypothetical protein Y032_0306g1974 [Ancylostoma ceylanicum]